jgi:hypothetical protein
MKIRRSNQLPTLWQILTDLYQRNLELRDAHRLLKAQQRAIARCARRQRKG